MTSQDTHEAPGTGRLPLTFGVELEFAFLIDQIAVDKPTSRHTYLQPANLVTDDDDVEMGMDPILDQLALQAATIIRNRDLDVIFRSTTKADPDYDHWILTYESQATIEYDGGYTLNRYTNGRINPQNHTNWNTQGMELVSRVLPCPSTINRHFLPNGLSEVDQYLKALNPGVSKPYIFLANEHVSGLHVHIGIDPSSPYFDTFPTLVVQHLAFICLAYEDIISLFHHPQRRGFRNTKTYAIAEPNRYGIVGHRHTCGRKENFDLCTAAEKIFRPTMGLEDLAALMDQMGFGSSKDVDDPDESINSRMKFVSFEYLHPDSGKHTVEFRQHVGTLDYESIKQWVIFLTALVRAAERLADTAAQPVSPYSPRHGFPRHLNTILKLGQLRKYRTIYAGDEDRLDALYDLLQLSRTQREFWNHRIKKYRQTVYTSFPTYMLCVACEEQGGYGRTPLSSLAAPDDHETSQGETSQEETSHGETDGENHEVNRNFFQPHNHQLHHFIGDNNGMRSPDPDYDQNGNWVGYVPKPNQFPRPVLPGFPGYDQWLASITRYGNPWDDGFTRVQY